MDPLVVSRLLWCDPKKRSGAGPTNQPGGQTSTPVNAAVPELIIVITVIRRRSGQGPRSQRQPGPNPVPDPVPYLTPYGYLTSDPRAPQLCFVLWAFSATPPSPLASRAATSSPRAFRISLQPLPCLPFFSVLAAPCGLAAAITSGTAHTGLPRLYDVSEERLLDPAGLVLNYCHSRERPVALSSPSFPEQHAPIARLRLRRNVPLPRSPRRRETQSPRSRLHHEQPLAFGDTLQHPTHQGSAVQERKINLAVRSLATSSATPNPDRDRKRNVAASSALLVPT